MEEDDTWDNDIVKTDDGFVFNPYNPLNIEITLSDVQSILTAYGIPPIVNNIKLYKRAFVHKSYTKRPHLENIQQNVTIVDKPDDCMPLSTKCNERLEYLGDGILEGIAKYLLYRRFPKEDEGFMTTKKIAIVKNEAIGKIAYEMGLHKWLIISRHSEEKGVRKNLKKLGCLFEAFIGAMFLDFNKIVVKDSENWFQTHFVTGPGFQMTQRFIETVFEKHVDWTSVIQNNDNYKAILQVKLQKEFRVTPNYLQLNEILPNETNDNIIYNMGVFLCVGQSIHHMKASDAIKVDKISKIHDIINNEGKAFVFLGEGTHKAKKKAEQFACQQALTVLQFDIE